MAPKDLSKPRHAPSSAAAVLAESVDDAAFATTLAKGLVVLEAFKAGSTLLGNMELSTLTGIPRPTVARLTHTLAELGYLRYDAERAKFRVAARALRIAHPLLAGMQFRQVARPMMQELALSVRGTVSIGLLDATSVIYVETARSGDVGPHAPDIGMPIPVVMTAMGRAAAATLPPADAERLERNIATEDAELWSAFRDKYRAGITQCKSRGFCTCWGEYMASIHAVAAPLFHVSESRQSFSINCGIPAFRLQPGQLEGEIGPRIAALADSIRAIVGQAAPALPARKTKKINTGT
ncbi:IclR family transcriptional regulator [Bradyrhizobium diazoefficiens]|nr:IclR family transcriptional regulator [Bradyrhizobium diazoefficiens]MBR0703287.1 IclR family transcriptional regulator [Bradyrhizobium diazoefficiens]MBR0772043.1 IclR family transcriptional regulator [Bradyrhizobium diazoefficiens]